MKQGSRNGFTLLEVLVAATVMAVGITGCLLTIGAIQHGESTQEQHEQLRRLAFQRYNEVAATVDLTQGGSSGDFSTWNLPNIAWTATVSPTGTTNLSQLDVTVTDNSKDNFSDTVSGLVYVPSTTTSTSGSGAGGAPGTGGGSGAPGGGP